MPGVRVTWVAADPGPQKTGAGMAIVAPKALGDLPHPDVILVPGALDVRPVIEDERVLAWLRAAHERTHGTTSVCTGALILGAAGAVAQTVQLAIEYDPAPPLSGGSPKTASPAVLEAARNALIGAGVSV